MRLHSTIAHSNPVHCSVQKSCAPDLLIITLAQPKDKHSGRAEQCALASALSDQ